MRYRAPVASGLALALAISWTSFTAVPAQAAAPGLAISVPSAVSFGASAVGARTISAILGPVTVTTGIAVLGGGWTTTVSTSGFTTGAGSAAESIPAASVAYKSGTATASSGLSVGACTPGQPVATVALSAPRTAYICTSLSSLSATSLTWNPTVAITVGANNVVGTYTGTITHSAA